MGFCPKTDRSSKKRLYIYIDVDTEYYKVLVRLGTSSIEIDQEYFMYDMVSVVSSIGGGIGIFLGYSCFGILSSAIKNLFDLLK